MNKDKVKKKSIGKLPLKRGAYIDETGMTISPATDLMKKVAIATMDTDKMKQSFTPAEIKEILGKRERQEQVSKTENATLNKETRANKRWVRNCSVGDYSRIFIYPSYTNKNGQLWYKMIDFSALYFAYYLAERMGMSVNIFPDTDNYVKSDYVCSIMDIEKVAEGFMQFGGKKVEITATGVYILTLANPMTADDYANLIKLEEEKRDRVHNILKPAAMAPATYKIFIDLLRQFAPKIQKLEKRNFFALGQNMMETLQEILKTYYNYSDGFITEEVAGTHMIAYVSRLRADLAILQELDAWRNLATAAMMGETLMKFREQVFRDFKIKIGRERTKQC